ncbi:hypothetical protein LI82_10075 [Methanococcoides methylutens]|uniref:ATPase n=1 Tax=Methanococcoides methylutens TaxID=2226 RepID=A0A099T1R6_METMT|nr:ATP-binding protein [Methanococcoides methylutens]KGK98078.1 hypothetical protein LI82_10075 [Methanococcoides methylutens]
MVRFFGRENELDMLKDIYDAPGSSMVVLYGRRRVGKTELSREFLKDRKGLYFFIETKSEELLLNDLEAGIETITGMRPRLESFDDLFPVLFGIEEKLVIVFDEFQNLAKVNPDLFSKFQKHWDSYHRENDHMFIMIGSYIGMMKKIFEESKEPLFGRATSILNIRPFTFAESYSFLSGMNPMDFEEAMKTYFILGGVPKYLLLSGQFHQPDAMQMFRKLFVEMKILLEEAKNILILEFGSEHKGYFSILEGIASGKSTPKEISDYTAIPPATVSKYLHELVHRYEIVRKEEPVTGGGKRNGRYFLDDNFFTFWFRFIHKYYGVFEIDPERAEQLVLKDINTYFGYAFEDVAKEILISCNKQGLLPLRFTDIGRWWSKDTEIDLIAFDRIEHEALFCEVKWKHLTETDARKIVTSLKKKSEKVSGKWNSHYCLIGKSIENKEELPFLTLDLADLEEHLKARI